MTEITGGIDNLSYDSGDPVAWRSTTVASMMTRVVDVVIGVDAGRNR